MFKYFQELYHPEFTRMKETDLEYLKSKYDCEVFEDEDPDIDRIHYLFWPKGKGQEGKVSVVKGAGTIGIRGDLWEAVITTENGYRGTTGRLSDKKMIKYVELVLDSGLPLKRIFKSFRPDEQTTFNKFKAHIDRLKKLKKEKGKRRR